MNSENNTRPGSPESILTRSFHDANSTIDDLTNALTSLSHLTTPESTNTLTCCCGRINCENLMSWMNTKSHLENRLDLSGQIGQALLQKHDAYVRSHETRKQQQSPKAGPGNLNIAEAKGGNEAGEDELEILRREHSQLEKRLRQALGQSEELEASKQTILLELTEARTAISRLTAQQARSAGWETRLATMSREKDDMQQERDAESNRAKLAESRLAAMKDKTVKLQSDVRRLQDTLTERAMHRTQSSEDTLRDARTRIAAIHQAEVGRTAMIEQTEIMEVLESLVNDNDALQRDNGELQTALADSREEIHSLKEELEELKIKPIPRSGATTPFYRQSFNGLPASLGRETSMHLANARSISIERRRPRRSFEPLSPEMSQRPVSPAESTNSETRWASFAQPEPSSATSTTFGDEPWNQGDDTIRPPETRRARKPLLLLTRSRGVQTEPIPVPVPSPLPSYSSLSPQDPRSESSSYSETPSSSLAVILERITSLVTRISQADALTLTNRLKRQHLRGADVAHLSRTTVNGIINELSNLRGQFRYLLEDDSVVSTCTRKDFRNLFRVFKDLFQELGELRVVLNDVILDPTVAKRVSDAAMNPTKAEAGKQEKEGAGGSGIGAWIAPISKLLSPTGPTTTERQSAQRPAGLRPTARAPTSSRFVPKQQAALSASATTVNVEFTGTGAGRSTTSTVEPPTVSGLQSPPISKEPSASSAVMNIFAGAPQPSTAEPWIVIPKGPRKVQSFIKPSSISTTGIVGRSATMSIAHRNRGISRDLDAIIDVSSPITDSNEEEPDIVGPLFHRTLRRRGLSDSSIHSSFTNQGAAVAATEEAGPSTNTGASGPTTYGSLAWPEKMSVFGALSRTVQNLRNTAQDSFTEFAGSLAPSAVTRQSTTPSPLPSSSASINNQSMEADAPVSSSPKNLPSKPPKRDPSRGASPSRIRDLLPALSSWAAAGELMENDVQGDALMVGSSRDPVFIPRVRRGPHHGQDFL